MQSIWPPRAATLVVWLLAGASTVFWGLRLMSVAPPDPAVSEIRSSGQPGDSVADTAALARLLGAGTVVASATAAPAPVASRFALTGVIAQHQRAGAAPVGVALISIDGKPARPYRVGDRLDEAYLLQSVGSASVVLAAFAQAPPGLTLSLPKPLPMDCGGLK